MFRSISEILVRKRAGVDCTDDESAAVKQHLDAISWWFPSEFAEWHDEVERGDRNEPENRV